MKKIFSFLTLIFLALSVFAQNTKIPTIVVKTGSQTGTYYRMMGELSTQCRDSVKITVLPSSGSIENIEDLLDNKANMVLAQNDAVIVLSSSNPNAKTIKSLMPLYNEEIHLLGLTNYPKEGGRLGFGGSRPEFADTEATAGRKVVTYGGSTITANIINEKLGLNWNISETASFEDAIAEIRSGRSHFLMAVGGAKIQAFTKLSSEEFRLIGFSSKHLETLNQSFPSTTISYRNLKQDRVNVPTVQATLFVRDYTTGPMIPALLAFKKCLNEQINDIAQTPGTHPKWASVRLPSSEEFVPSRWPAWKPPVMNAEKQTTKK